MRFIKIVFIFMLLTACASQDNMLQGVEKNLVKEKTRSLLNLGDRMAASGDFPTALQFYHQAHIEQPQLNEPIFKQYDLLMQGNEIGVTDELLAKAVAVDPKDEDMSVKYAKFLIQYNLPKAPTVLKTISETFKNARFYNWYGVALDLNGFHNKAQKVYEKGRSLEPNNASLINNLALSYAVTRQSGLSIRLFDQLVEQNPNKILYYRNRAIAQTLAGQYNSVREGLQNVMRDIEIERLISEYQGRLQKESPLQLLKSINNMN